MLPQRRVYRDSLISRDSPSLTAPTETNCRRGGTRVRIKTIVGIKQLGTWYRSIERLDSRRGTIHNGSTGIDNGLEPGYGCLAFDNSLTAGCLPESTASDTVIFDVARVQVTVSSAKEEFGTGLGEFESEDIFGNSAFCKGVLIEWWLDVLSQ